MLALNLPINTVSFGQVSTAIVRELASRKKDFLFSGVGPIDLSAQSEEPELKVVLETLNKNFAATHSRENPIFKLWHLSGSLESFSQKQFLLSFYELDSPTKMELNIVKNNHKVYFSSEEAVNLFKSYGCLNVDYLPLAFDKWNFSETGKKYFQDGRIVFNLAGKLEKRKHHAKAIRAWIKRFGNNRKYCLQCAVYNPFLKPEDNNASIKSIVGESKPFNVSFLGFMQKNSMYNDFVNSGDIVLAMSGGEGWGLPEFQSVCLGKHAVTLYASGYKGWANDSNSCLVYPSGKTSSVDNMFFRSGDSTNQGSIYDFNDDEFIAACEKAISRVESERVNNAGKELKDKFSYAKLVDKLIEDVK